MLVRALLQVTAWGAMVAAYGTLGEPRLCEKKAKKRAVLVIDEPPPAAMPAPVSEAPAIPPADDVFAPEAPTQ